MQNEPKTTISEGAQSAPPTSERVKELVSALEKISELCCYASEEAPEAKDFALQQIGALSRSVLGPAEHVASAGCWCSPEVDYKDPDTGATVYVHRGRH